VRFSVVLSARFGCDEVLSIDDILDWVNVSSHLSAMVGDDGNRSSMLFPIRINDLSISFWRAFGEMEQKVMSLLLLLFKIDGARVGEHSIMFACSLRGVCSSQKNVAECHIILIFLIYRTVHCLFNSHMDCHAL
jgi:hypothetical protein